MMHSPCRTSPISKARGRAFTLIELLVVVAIIALLISILLPSLSMARKQARTVVCGTQLKEIGNAYAQYLLERQDRFAHYDLSNNGTFFDVLRPILFEVDDLMICPETRKRDIRATAAANAAAGQDRPQRTRGAAKATWVNRFNKPDGTAREGAEGVGEGSYTVNGFLYNTNGYEGLPENRNGNRWSELDMQTEFPDYWWQKLVNIKYPAVVPFYADGIWFSGWPIHENRRYVNWPRDYAVENLRNPPGTFDQPPPDNPFGQLGRFMTLRHQQSSINLVFVDGHIERINVTKLVDLQWGPEFKAKERTSRIRWPSELLR